jgi:hypothetical protein
MASFCRLTDPFKQLFQTPPTACLFKGSFSFYFSFFLFPILTFYLTLEISQLDTMHDAFLVTTVVDKVSRIESIFAYGKQVLPRFEC